MGEVQVPADNYWARADASAATRTSRSAWASRPCPEEITHAFGVLKKAAAMANHELKPEKMTDEKLAAISQACDEVISGSAERALPAGGLADGQRHPVQHERQRGHCQPRQ